MRIETLGYSFFTIFAESNEERYYLGNSIWKGIEENKELNGYFMAKDENGNEIYSGDMPRQFNNDFIEEITFCAMGF